MLRRVVGNGKLEAVGQLEKNWSWEIVFKKVVTKEFMQSDVTVRERSAMRIFDFQHPTRMLSIVRVSTCNSNEFIAAKLNEKGVKVVKIWCENQQDRGRHIQCEGGYDREQLRQLRSKCVAVGVRWTVRACARVYAGTSTEMPPMWRAHTQGGRMGNRTTRRQTNSRSVKSRTGQLAEMFDL